MITNSRTKIELPECSTPSFRKARAVRRQAAPALNVLQPRRAPYHASACQHHWTCPERTKKWLPQPVLRHTDGETVTRPLRSTDKSQRGRRSPTKRKCRVAPQPHGQVRYPKAGPPAPWRRYMILRRRRCGSSSTRTAMTAGRGQPCTFHEAARHTVTTRAPAIRNIFMPHPRGGEAGEEGWQCHGRHAGQAIGQVRRRAEG